MFAEDIFSLKPLLTAEDDEVKLCAQSSVGRHQILALVTGFVDVLQYICLLIFLLVGR